MNEDESLGELSSRMMHQMSSDADTNQLYILNSMEQILDKMNSLKTLPDVEPVKQMVKKLKTLFP